jgi:membrane complex biogenesis BtpA family protein
MDRPLIGMLHLPPLAGSPRSGSPHNGGNRTEPLAHVLADAETLVENGIGQLMLENFGDAPFYPAAVPSHVVAQMTAIAAEIKRRFDVPLGINVLRNDGCAALSIAHAVGAQFVRVNVLCGARLTDQGIIQGIAHDLLRLRKTLGADAIRILADVDVKHSSPLREMPLENEVEDLIQRGLADAVIVSGSSTGRAASIEQLRQAKQAAGDRPVYVGSGVTPENIGAFWKDGRADGFIVGSSLKRDGVTSQPVDVARVKKLVEAFDKCAS